MTHEPLCPKMPEHVVIWTKDPCQCDLIAKIRADEREHCIAEVEALGPLQQFKTWDEENGCPLWGYHDVDVAEALRGES